MSPDGIQRALRHLRWRTRRGAHHARRYATTIVNSFRRGHRTVVVTPRAGLRLGNLLYLWLRAHHRSASGRPTVVLFAPGMEEWLRVFPRLRSLTIMPSDVAFWDRREWDNTFLYQRFGIDFARDQLDAFVRDCLASEVVGDAAERLVVNVRRGDYYTVFREKYAFDLMGYLTTAIKRSGAVSEILVVSDDAAWCREHLGSFLDGVATSVMYAEPDPLANFMAVASARRIVGTNSTFSYWGAYVATALHADAQVIMPEFHGRMAHGTAAHQLDPNWTAIPGFH